MLSRGVLINTSSQYEKYAHFFVRAVWCVPWLRAHRRYNLSRLEEWCRDNEVCGSGCSEGGGALEQLQPIVQASKLLQMRKSRESDAEAISELCTRLNPLQVHTSSSYGTLQLYTGPHC